MYNVVWLFIDSVRRYYSDDDRSRFKFMDEFAKESVEFKNVVTSAPSTFMSVSAMMSGMPSYYINRNFDDFIFDKGKIGSLTNDLESEGFNLYSFIMHKDTREKMINILPMIDRKYWPKELSHSMWWSNSDINKSVGKTLKMGVEKPSFFFVDYNCRDDFEVGDKVEWALKEFRKAGYTKDNTITIICSDHGYPDAKKDTGRPDYYVKKNLGHDVVLTDDNVMIPMFIQYPGCKEGLKIDTCVSSIDLYPTIMDLNGFNNENIKSIHGKSWSPLMKGDAEYTKMMENRFHRCDNRFTFQTNKGTVIRNGEFKYINFHGEKIGNGEPEEFFDIKKDPLEVNNLIKSDVSSIKDQIESFRNEFNKSEELAFEYQTEYLFKKVLATNGSKLKNANKILILDSANPTFIKMIKALILKINIQASISILKVEHEFENSDLIHSKHDSWSQNIVDDAELISTINSKLFDLVIIPLNGSEGRDNNSLRKFSGKIKKGKKLFIDYNFQNYTRTILNYHWKRFKPMFHFAKNEPLYLFKFLFNNTFKYIKMKTEKEKW
jgi:hypothetical protein